MTQYLVDASVAAKWFIPEPHAAEADRLINDNDDLWAPELILHEVASVMLKRLRRGETSETQVRGALERLPLLVRPISSAVVAPLSIDIAIRYQRSSYDAVYVALALERGCQLVTADRKLYNALATTDLARSLLWIGHVPGGA